MGMGSNFLALDFETANYASDSACAIGLVKVRRNKIVAQETFLIKPPSRNFMFTSIHGLTWKDVAKSPTFGELWEEIEEYFHGNDFIAAHNASFDRRVLMAYCARYGIDVPQSPFSCTVQLARKTWNLHPTKLSNVCQHLGITLKHHEALSDALACAKIVLATREIRI